MSKTILLVDDETDIVELLTIRLKASGFEVISAMDGQEALDKVKQKAPDLILLDEMMPKISGFKVCGLLKADSRFKHIPIIIHTARVAHEEDIALSKQLGADLLVSKMIKFEDLVDKINELVNKDG